MSDLISRAALIEQVCAGCELREAGICKECGDVMGCLVDEINRTPDVDAEPVKHGHWIEQEAGNLDTYYTCSACKEDFCLIEGEPSDNLWNYCPNCGAKMDETKGE